MKRLLAIFGLFSALLLFSACQMQDMITGKYSGPMPGSQSVCNQASYTYFFGHYTLDQAYNQHFGNALDIASSSYENGVYHCEYTIPKDYVATDSENTYYHHATYLVGVEIDMDMVPNSGDLSTPIATNPYNASLQIYEPLHETSDVITGQINTATLDRQNQAAQQQLNDMIQRVEQYDEDHPCEVYSYSNNVLVCLKRRGEL